MGTVDLNSVDYYHFCKRRHWFKHRYVAVM